jgi:carbonic anhydrase
MIGDNKMTQLDSILSHNQAFVENKDYAMYSTDKYPYKKMIVFSCMDTRLTHLLPNAMNLKNGDAKIIKNAGATIMHPFGSIMRSMIVAIYELHAEEIFVVGHKGCGMSKVDTDSILTKMTSEGITDETLLTLKYADIDIKKWLHGFDSVEDSVRESVDKIKHHPLIPHRIIVHGLVMDPETGKLDMLINGYDAN